MTAGERPPRATCPSCGGDQLTPFHAQAGVPVHSCLLVGDRSEATDFPRGDLDLAACAACGFAFNRAFDPATSAYSESYEETQGFSGRFRSFAESLARRWVDRHDLRGKRIVEVGCGKGEFLDLVCRIGGNQGVGIDPSYVPGRLETSADVRFIQELYRPEHASIEADAIICRHTLEHIPDVAAFLQLVRTAAAARDDVVVLFELPDLLRVLREAAWWDLYYEHCSYFSPGTLVRLFERSGLEVVDLAMAFDDQYITIDARPVATAPRPFTSPLVEPVTEVLDAVEAFRTKERATIEHWRRRVGDVAAAGGRTAIWGAGSKGVAFVHAVGGDGIHLAVDINPHKQQQFLPGGGQPILGPEALVDDPPALVIAMNPIYTGEIRAELERLGLDVELDAV